MMPRIYTPRVETTCENCGTVTMRAPHAVPKHRFCSAECRFEYAHKERVARLWSQVRKDDRAEACWEWQGTHRPKGYGIVSRGRHPIYAHRFAFEIAYGPIPEGMMVCHTCDNPACVRNDDEGWYEVNGVLLPRRGHLFLGTTKDNTADKIAKGRARSGSKYAFATHCKHGHEFTPENTYISRWNNRGPARVCRACHRDRFHARKQRLLYERRDAELEAEIARINAEEIDEKRRQSDWVRRLMDAVVAWHEDDVPF
jgi:hypothetical protein